MRLFIFSVLMLAFASSAQANIKMASKAAYTKERGPVYEFLQSECAKDSATGCQNLGDLHLELGEKKQAEVALNRACELGRSEACTKKN